MPGFLLQVPMHTLVSAGGGGGGGSLQQHSDLITPWHTGVLPARLTSRFATAHVENVLLVADDVRAADAYDVLNWTPLFPVGYAAVHANTNFNSVSRLICSVNDT